MVLRSFEIRDGETRHAIRGSRGIIAENRDRCHEYTDVLERDAYISTSLPLIHPRVKNTPFARISPHSTDN